MSVVGATLTILGSDIPELGLRADHTSFVVGQNWFILRTVAMPSVGVQDKSCRTGQARQSRRVPLSGGWAIDTVSG